MLSHEQEEQERLYHEKNALFLRVQQKSSAQRNADAYRAFLTLHTELQDRVRSSGILSTQDISSLTLLASHV